MRWVWMIALFVSCGGAQHNHNLKDVNGTPFNGPAFGISFPSGWTVKEGVAFTNVIAIAPKTENDAFTDTISVVLENQPENISANAYMTKSIPILERVLQDFKVISQDTKDLPSGERIAMMEYTHVVRGETIKALTGYVMIGKAGYVVTGVADEPQYDGYSTTFVQTIDTLKFKK